MNENPADVKGLIIREEHFRVLTGMDDLQRGELIGHLIAHYYGEDVKECDMDDNTAIAFILMRDRALTK